MNHIIELETMQFFAYHGCFDEEKVVGNKFTVDLRLQGDFSKAAATDNLEDALDYQKAYQVVKTEMAQPSDLLEHVAGRILDHLYRVFDSLEQAEVKVAKKNPPIGGEMHQVSVTMAR